MLRIKTFLLGTAACLTLPVVFSSTAVANTYERCDADGGHCVRVTCDRDGDECWRRSEYYNNEMYRHEGQWVCDSGGNRCHYQYSGRREGHEHEHEHEHEHD